MNEINLYMDESGNLGTGGRYFLICALEVDNNLKSSISKRAGRVICRYKLKNKIEKSEELKGWKLDDVSRVQLINKILFKGIKVRFVVLDLKHTTMLLKKADDKNACFNYLVQLIVKEIVKKNKVSKINLYLDNRSVKVGNRLSLKPYLYNKFVLEQLESSHNYYTIEFNVNYLESERCYLIEWADIISNSLYKKYNSGVDDFYNIIKPYITSEIKFPYKKFGK